jgi:kynurenine formamidase
MKACVPIDDLVAAAERLPNMPASAEPVRAADLHRALRTLRGARWIDLTHPFFPGIPHYAAFPDEQRERLSDYADGGFRTHRYSLVGQWGTHVDPPSHFDPDGTTLDALAVREMLLELVVLDARPEVAADPGFVAGPELIDRHEAVHGRIPSGAFVALRTGWSAHWPDPEAMANGGRSPGWSVAALHVLIGERAVAAVGHEQTDTDPGLEVCAGRTDAEAYVLSAGRWQIEMLADLAEVPERGALLLASWPRPAGGSGFPARCVAIVPELQTPNR